MGAPANIERATDRDAVNASMVLAFAADPVFRWIYPDSRAYLRNFPGFVAALGGPAFETGETLQVDDHAAASVWLPPGVRADPETILSHLVATCPAEKLDEMMQIAMQMGEHHPTFPHWYLVWLGVDANRQGQGLGARLIQHTLRKVDESGLPAYLESPNPRNIPFYQRHGFEVIGMTRTATASPIHFMLRPPR